MTRKMVVPSTKIVSIEIQASLRMMNDKHPMEIFQDALGNETGRIEMLGLDMNLESHQHKDN